MMKSSCFDERSVTYAENQFQESLMNIPKSVRKYSGKIPKSVRLPMAEFTSSDCVLVDRHFASGSRSQQGNCFINVARQAKKYGGQSIHGWMLNYNENIQAMGMWSWQFHAIWETPWDTWLDISKFHSYDSIGNKFTWFWIDKKRKANIQEGTAYNSVIAFERMPPPNIYDESAFPIKVGQLYWTAGGFGHLKKLSQHSGVYRFCTKNYPRNVELLESKYGIRKQGNSVVSVTGSDSVPHDALFDFNIGRR